MWMLMQCLFGFSKSFNFYEFIAFLKLYDQLYPETEPIAVPDTNSGHCVASLAVASIWGYMHRKNTQITDQKPKARPIPNAMKAHLALVPSPTYIRSCQPSPTCIRSCQPSPTCIRFYQPSPVCIRSCWHVPLSPFRFLREPLTSQLYSQPSLHPIIVDYKLAALCNASKCTSQSDVCLPLLMCRYDIDTYGRLAAEHSLSSQDFVCLFRKQYHRVTFDIETSFHD